MDYIFSLAALLPARSTLFLKSRLHHMAMPCTLLKGISNRATQTDVRFGSFGSSRGHADSVSVRESVCIAQYAQRSDPNNYFGFFFLVVLVTTPEAALGTPRR
jgi:hypothetical protein